MLRKQTRVTQGTGQPVEKCANPSDLPSDRLETNPVRGSNFRDFEKARLSPRPLERLDSRSAGRGKCRSNERRSGLGGAATTPWSCRQDGPLSAGPNPSHPAREFPISIFSYALRSFSGFQSNSFLWFLAFHLLMRSKTSTVRQNCHQNSHNRSSA